MAAQGLDEAGEGGQRGAKFVAGVGQEIRPHALVSPTVGLVAHHEQGQERTVGFLGQGAGKNSPEPVLGAAAFIARLPGHAAEQALVDRLEHPGVADGGDQGDALALYAEQIAGGEIGESDPAVGKIQGVTGGNYQHRVGQAFHDGGEARSAPLAGGADFGDEGIRERHDGGLQGDMNLSRRLWRNLGAAGRREPRKPVVHFVWAQRPRPAARGIAMNLFAINAVGVGAGLGSMSGFVWRILKRRRDHDAGACRCACRWWP